MDLRFSVDFRWLFAALPKALYVLVFRIFTQHLVLYIIAS